MKKINVAINGFGRIGRGVFKAILEKHKNINVVAINDLADTKTLAHLLKYDSAYGIYPDKISSSKNSITVNKKSIPVFAIKDPSLLPWKKLKIDVVLECTGIFRKEESLKAHLEAGAKKVVLSAPAKGGKIKTVVLGVNEKDIKKSDNLLSCASCTTNCLAPVSKVIKEKFGIKKALMTTVHAYTAGQNLVDGPNKDLRRARAAAVNMLPTSTGAAIATTEVIPSLKNKFDGLAVRVPVVVGSLCDCVYLLNKKTDLNKVKTEFIKASKGKLKGILRTSDEEIVSSDIIGDSHSSIVDLPSSKLIDGDLLKVVAWYDNEWGYSNRLADLTAYISKYIK